MGGAQAEGRMRLLKRWWRGRQAGGPMRFAYGGRAGRRPHAPFSNDGGGAGRPGAPCALRMGGAQAEGRMRLLKRWWRGRQAGAPMRFAYGGREGGRPYAPFSSDGGVAGRRGAPCALRMGGAQAEGRMRLFKRWWR